MARNSNGSLSLSLSLFLSVTMAFLVVTSTFSFRGIGDWGTGVVGRDAAFRSFFCLYGTEVDDRQCVDISCSFLIGQKTLNRGREAQCQYNCTRNVLWCQVHSSHIHCTKYTGVVFSLCCRLKMNREGRHSPLNRVNRVMYRKYMA